MSQLGSYFPDEEKRAFAKKHLKPGQIVYLPCKFTRPPKDKFLVLLCPDTPPLLFMINSIIHPFIVDNPQLLKSQVKLGASEYAFLDHDSFVDCSRVICSISEKELTEQISADIGIVRGEITSATKQQIIQVVTQSRTVPRKHKRRILIALQEGKPG